jgi:signal peptidase II
VVLAVVLGLDLLTKWLVTSNLAWGQSVPAEGFFRITRVHNTGSAFGLFQGHGTILAIIAIAAVALMIWFYRTAPMPAWPMRAALGLQIGGAVGNLIDRFRYGFVIDFVDIGPWPVFNVADSSVVVGITILAWYIGTGRDLPRKPPQETTPADESPSDEPRA